MHKLLFLLLTLSLYSACSNPNKTEEEENKKIIARLYEELINQKKIGNIELYYEPKVVDHSAWPGQAPGREGLRQAIEDFHKSYQDLHVQVDEVLTSGNKVITRETWKGVNSSTSKPFTGTVMHIYQLQNGKVTDEWSEGWEWLQ
jgi:predicted SnoaL-like aldol condensation-catalyzing enzyme